MKYPLFRTGDHVYYAPKGGMARVELSFWDGTAWRYYLIFRGGRFSAAEGELSTKIAVLSGQQKQGVTEGENPKTPATDPKDPA